jgi:peptidoglycan/LPS O-acetylase OafA/YrhL
MSSPSLADNPLGKSDYRPDIDGLRAIAVLAVVVYHAFPSLIQGGFVGVDIFFVISGFLISKHLWEDLAAGTYRLRTFYARRVRRIFPALGVVLLASLAFGWVVLSPGEYEQLGKHVTGGAGFVSNLLYWKEAGYFDSAADTKPLLHLWSLGIEEQFYIAWPLILAFLWRRPHHASWVLPGVLGLSLGYSLWLVQRDTVADFYSPLSRFWELAVGAMLAHETARRLLLSTFQRNLLAILGLALIIAGIVWLESRDPFPGYWALLPVLGAACLIQAGGHSWINHHLLARKWLVWVGLISYPLYLWHWPLLSYARIMESATPTAELRAVLVVASVWLAWITYRWVERPLRSRPRSRTLILWLCLGLFALALAGEAVRKLDGIKSRKQSMLNGDPATLVLGADRGRLQQECGLTDEQKPLFQYCLRSAPHPRFALLGDSKAEALYYGLVRESAPGESWMMMGSVAAPALAPGAPGKQQLKNQLALQTVLADPLIQVVGWVVALRGIFPLDSASGFITSQGIAPEVIASFDQAIGQLEQAGKRVVFVIDNPTFPDPRSCLSGGATASPFLNQWLRRKENPRCAVAYSDHLSGTRLYREFIGELARRHPGLIVYDPSPRLCDVPHNVCTVTREGKFLYSYGDHISDYANSMLALDLLPIMRQLAGH